MKVIVCGAGIAGLALAHRLSALGQEVIVLERSPGPRTQGYMIDFFGPGLDAMEAMGLLPALRDVAYQVPEALLVDDRGRSRARVATDRFAAGELLSVTRPDLEDVLRAHLPDGVDLRYGVPVVDGAQGDGVRVTTADGSTVDGDVLIGADGIHSAVRRIVFGPERDYLRYLGFHTAAYTFDAPHIHEEVDGRFCLTDSIGSQFGFYALRDGRVASFAVHRTPDPVLPTDLRAAIQSAYSDLGWVVPEALAACPAPDQIYYDQVAQIVMPSWSKGRVGLVGDACQAVSLLAGQGASLGIAGAYVLAGELARATSPEAGLAAYERVWRPIAEEKQKVGRSAARWFLPASRTQLILRRLMLRLPFARQLLAAALAGKPTTLIRELA
ncbi:FAD-dependent oxidoreductase [Kribbella sp. NPDC056345]|uniref:FAD-dependent oxidoreductase n=1 Tax=Kribbella sp. NPDC056345 TaxID=3345789 RepID=UPI0035D6C4D8